LLCGTEVSNEELRNRMSGYTRDPKQGTTEPPFSESIRHASMPVEGCLA
jgi:hypothetical protein